MMPSVLQRILASKRAEVAAAARERPLASLDHGAAPPPRDFRGALAAASGPGFILEVKRQSPSRGALAPTLDLSALVALYDRHADAISVLTDGPFFGGSLADLRAVRAETTRPVLRKDFIIDPYQLVEARAAGADAVLLIVAALSDERLAELLERTRALGMAALVEVHDAEEFSRALRCGADCVGINHRNLHDLSIDLGLSARLSAAAPPHVLTVAESGLATRADVLAVAPHARALLIGSAITGACDPAAKVRELVFGRVKVCGITRRADAEAAFAAGATYVGLVFHPQSPRVVTAAAAAEVAAGLAGPAIGVFGAASPAELLATVRTVGLAGVQVHAPDPEPALRAVRAAFPGGLTLRPVAVGATAAAWPETAASHVLFDTHDPARAGGTGRRFDLGHVAALRAERPADWAERVFVAGGLTPANVADVARLGPFALDLSSGLEAAPGVKDPARLAQLFATLRALPHTRPAPGAGTEP